MIIIIIIIIIIIHLLRQLAALYIEKKHNASNIHRHIKPLLNVQNTRDVKRDKKYN